MKNRKLLLIVSLVLALTMSLGGTLAYLTDTDADVNTMVLGNVKIVQNEQEWNTGKTALQEFTQDKPLLPYVGALGWENKEQDNGAYRRFTMNNVVDKYVTVTNMGNTKAYVRTIIALEMGSCTYEELGKLIGASINAQNGSEFKFPGAWVWTDDYVAPIDGKNYNIMVAVHQAAVEPKATTIPSLLQVYLSKDAGNEDLEKLDGNKNGKFDILVISQAVQADGFTNATEALEAGFGKVTANERETVASWFASIGDPNSDYQIGSPEGDKNNTNNPPAFVVENATDFAEAIAKASPGGTIALTADTDYGTLKIDGELNGVTIKGAENANVRFNIMPGAVLNNVTLTGINTTFADSSSYFVDGGVFNIDAGAEVKNLVIEDCVINGSGGRSSLVGCSEPSAEITVNNVKLKGTKYMVYASAPVAALTVEDCEIENVSSWAVMMNAGDSVGAKLTIDGNTFVNCTGGIAKYLGSSQPEGATTVFTNNILTTCTGHDGSDAKWFAIPGATSTITVSGNTLDDVEWLPGIAQGLGK